MTPRKTLICIAGLAATLVAAPASALVLLDQPNAGADTLINQVFPDITSYSTYAVDDVTFGMDVILTSVTVYMTLASEWPTTLPGVLNIFDGGSPPSATDVPGAGGDHGGAVALSAEIDGNVWVMTASGLNIALSAGSYMIGLTPSLSYGQYGQTYIREATTSNGSGAWVRNPGNGAGLGVGDWTLASEIRAGYGDLAMRIEGDAASVPAPAPLALLAFGVLGLAGVARRRSRAA